MRKFLSVFFILLGSAVGVFGAAPSAELNNFDDGDNYTNQGLYPIIKAEPIRYAYAVIPSKQAQIFEKTDDPLKNQIAQQTAQNNYKNIIEKNLKAWPLQTAEFIKKAGRAEEFADLLPLLTHVKVENVNSREKASVFFTFSDMDYILSLPGSMGACGVTSDFARPIEINILDPNLDISTNRQPCYSNFSSAYDFTDKVTLHEIGHYYALAEQYDTSNASVLYSDSDRINRDSIMGASYSKQLSCDDVDGFIKIADRTFYKINGKYNARDNKGWKSFCNDGTIYKQGKVQNRTPFYSDWKIYSYDANGDILTITDKYPFIFSDTDIIVRDEKTGHIQKIIDPTNNVYTLYDYLLSAQNKSLEVGMYSLKDDNKKFSAEFYKNTSGNFWEINRFNLFIKPNKCHFVYKGSRTMNIYVNVLNDSLEWDFSWGGNGQNYSHVKKYDFKGKDYKCEYILSKGPDSPAQEVFWHYVLQYRADQQNYVLLEGKMSPAQKEKYWPYLVEACGRNIEEMTSLKSSYFVPICQFFSEIDPVRAIIK